LKYLEVLDTKDTEVAPPAARAIAGIIGPY